MKYQLFHFALRCNTKAGMSRADALKDARAYAFDSLPF